MQLWVVFVWVSLSSLTEHVLLKNELGNAKEGG